MEYTFQYCEASKRHKEQTIMMYLEQVVQSYHNRGFEVCSILGDNIYWRMGS